MLLGLLVQIAAKLALWRSFGVVPANRGVKTRGPYRLLRHPMYAGYTLTHIGFLIGFPSLSNTLLYASVLALNVGAHPARGSDPQPRPRLPRLSRARALPAAAGGVQGSGFDSVVCRVRAGACRVGCRHAVLPVPHCLAPAARPSLGRRQEEIAALAPSGLVLVLDEKGNELVAQNADKPFVPASVTKIVTAWLALEVLGGDYRFQTRFYLDKDRVLYVRGGGDPFLVSEELALLAPQLVAAIGKEPFTGIVLDASYYPADLRIPGIEDTSESYDALNSALAVNFNTIHAVRHGNRSAPPKSRPRSPRWRSASSGRAVPKAGAASASPRNPRVSLQYAGELLAAFIEQAGGSVKGKITTGSVPAGLKPVYVHRQSRPLSEILTRVAPRLEQLHRQPGLPGDRRAPLGRARQPREVAQGRQRDLAAHGLAGAPSTSKRARASVAATASRRAASPRCSTCSRPTPTCSASGKGALV